MVVVATHHAFNPSTRKTEAEAGRSLSVESQSGLKSNFWDSQNYAEKSCLNKQKQKQKTMKSN